jgi:hypothetical protein
MAGSLGIGSTALTNSSLRVSKNGTGGTSYIAIDNQTVYQSDVTSTATGYNTFIGTASATFTLTNLQHYRATQAPISTNSSVTNQYGFWVDASIVGATNNYGYFGNIPSGTNRWNLYMQGTANNYMAGSLGIGTTFLTDTILNIAKNLTGASTSYGVRQTGAVQSDAFVSIGYQNQLNTQAASFTLSQYIHYNASQGTIGASSAITTNVGFNVSPTMIGGTNNYGFQGGIPAGTNRWNLYMQGTAANYLAGQLSIGTTSLTDFVNISNSTNGVTRVTTTNNNAGTSTQVQYQLSNGTHTASLGLTGTAFPSNLVFLQGGTYLTSGNSVGGLLLNTGAIQPIYFGVNNNEVARFGTNGALGLGSTTLTGFSLVVGKNITGSSNANGIRNIGQIQSDVTGYAVMYNSVASTAAASFTNSQLVHYFAQQGTIGAGSSVTSQYGFLAESSLTGATNNFGFYGNIASGTNRWNLYMQGTANNYLAGSLGIGSTALTGTTLLVSKNITGATAAYGVLSQGAIQSDVVSQANYFVTSASTQATTFTLLNLYHYRATQTTFGAGSTVTNQYGFFADNSLSSATNDYGFYGNIAADTNRWNLYMNGTAANYMAGNLGIGTSTSFAQLHVQSASNTRSIIQVVGTEALGDNAGLYFKSAINFADAYIKSAILFRNNGTGGGRGDLIFATNSSSTSVNVSVSDARLIVTSLGNIGINTITPDASAQLQVDSTTRGFLPPRMTTTQKLAIGTPAAGLMVYDTTLNQMSYYNGTLWINF